MRQLIADIIEGTDLRDNLIKCREQLKQPGGRETLFGLLSHTQEGEQIFLTLLDHEDPKVRRNAARILGELHKGSRNEAVLSSLYQAYQKESTLFVRADYLKAIGEMDCGMLAPRIREQYEAQASYVPTPEEEKHYREERKELTKLLLRLEKRPSHTFAAAEKSFDLILTCRPDVRDSVLQKMNETWPNAGASKVSLGVRVRRGKLAELTSIRTFREVLFLLDVMKVGPEPEKIAKELSASNLLRLLATMHGEGEAFRFRLSIFGGMTLEKRSLFIEKCAYALEQAGGRMLVNSASDYEMEIRLYERKDGSFLPLLKIFTWQDPRFTYRRESVSTSIHPSDAARICELTCGYLAERAAVLDPFCGVGTMLVERNLARKARSLLGIDLFGEAIEKARRNTAQVKGDLSFINRDFFDFTYRGSFDEIFTNMPVRGKKTKEEQDELYRRFFEKAAGILRPEGIMILYSNEKGFIKKQLRLQKSWKLLQEFPMNGKEEFSVYVICRGK